MSAEGVKLRLDRIGQIADGLIGLAGRADKMIEMLSELKGFGIVGEELKAVVADAKAELSRLPGAMPDADWAPSGYERPDPGVDRVLNDDL